MYVAILIRNRVRDVLQVTPNTIGKILTSLGQGKGYGV